MNVRKIHCEHDAFLEYVTGRHWKTACSLVLNAHVLLTLAPTKLHYGKVTKFVWILENICVTILGAGLVKSMHVKYFTHSIKMI